MVSLRQRCKVVVQRLKRRTCAYCDTTTLHGFRYITNPNSTKFQSIFWTIICIISTCLCVILILSQLHTYRTSRITTTIQSTTFPIWQIPFPAVTVCNFNVVYKENLGELQKLLANDFTSDEIDHFFANLSNLISVPSNSDETNFKWYKFHGIVKKLEHFGYDVDRLMAKLAQPCEKLLSACYWKTRQIDCNRIFQPSKSTSGYCCSFNYNGVDDGNFAENEPIYAAGVGRSFSLEIRLNPELDQYVSPIKQSKGVDVVLHEAHAFPDTSLFSTMIYPGSDLVLLVKPEIIESDDNVRNIDIKYRECVFQNEVEMAWAPLYSYSTCFNECKAKTIIDYCQCIPFYYPLKTNFRYCTLVDVPCLRQNSHRFRQTFNTNDLLQNQTQHQHQQQENTDCNCFPQCNKISYSYQIDQQPLKVDDGLTNTSTLSVSFGQITCTKFARNIFLTWEYVLASIGGLIGLCLGGSILSIIELIYYIFDTIFARYKKYQPKLYVSDFKHIKNLPQLNRKKQRF